MNPPCSVNTLENHSVIRYQGGMRRYFSHGIFSPSSAQSFLVFATGAGAVGGEDGGGVPPDSCFHRALRRKSSDVAGAVASRLPPSDQSTRSQLV